MMTEREEFERELVVLDKQSILSKALKFYDSVEKLKAENEKIRNRNIEVVGMNERLQKAYADTMSMVKTRRGRKALARSLRILDTSKVEGMEG